MNSILELNSGDEITFFGARSRADAECEIVIHNALVFAAKGTNPSNAGLPNVSCVRLTLMGQRSTQ
jgi:hypothetical protein